jgi:CheY-like chemotaxis protein
MRYILQSRNAKIEEAMNGAQALEQMEKQMPELLVLDLIMPELDGFEVLRRLRNDRRAVNLRTLVVTMKDLTVAEKAYLTRKMASLVGKGAAELDFFVEEVARALNSQPELSASLAH